MAQFGRSFPGRIIRSALKRVAAMNWLGVSTIPGSGAITSTALLKAGADTSIAGTGAVAPAGTSAVPGSMTALAGTGAVAASATSNVPGNTTRSGTGSVASSGTSKVPGVATPVITGTVFTHGVTAMHDAMTPLGGTGTIIALGGLHRFGDTGPLAGVGTIFCYGTVERPLPHPAGFPPPLASYPGATAIVADQMVSIHTARGVSLYDFLPTTQFSLKWGRAQRQVSKCGLVVPSPLNADTVPDIIPWLHWISVWNETGTSLLWTGPIQDWNANRISMTVDAADIGAYMTRTRQPLTKDWDNTDPADIANEMWTAMIANNNLGVTPIVRDDPEGTPFDFQAIASQTTMDKAISELVNLGLYWTVVAGVPVLGPAPATPWATLNDSDFMGGDGVTITRDGASTFNDVLLYAADGTSQARVDMAGLNLQTVVQANSIFGVDNADKAVVQYARYAAQIRDTVSLGQGTTLHPDAPVTLEQLIPSSKIALEAYGLLTTMMIDSVDVAASPQQGGQVSLTLEQYTDPLTLPQIARPAANNSNGLGAVNTSTIP